MLSCVLLSPSSLLTILELRMPAKGNASGYAMHETYGNAGRGGQAMRFKTSNPFAALDAAVELQSGGSGSSVPSSLSEGSTSQDSWTAATLAAAPRGSVHGGRPLEGQHLVRKRCFGVFLHSILT
ncbi:hypothetical protein HBH56_068130 [Parastagonospora nodorum]|uniref:Uncharacterized protein n=1 Tax=Phaeosphaeria nodorum (strain SN15 / ATCC MYA-4574 / FGSC 10173) TaxID=321614 RepID=A0A7U2EVB6_PHANO|nr:hypothetical protein HBH56_068130 [Parastagonospora nodorum]QRC93486.1 hypothetical protein JI435_403920 [Parastagonospora nodorum SN15]KAH3932448.1 hypothetical protein HBH54_079980 [Parastagonospora nodorum]KAH4143408.1 hypothetical protein HBH45_035000 [Parastagonospora nodorum]KAH4165675.1 hypothetical protein HBH44_068360 [Parastagonospora nodorum]